jgi:hypothetical protein
MEDFCEIRYPIGALDKISPDLREVIIFQLSFDSFQLSFGFDVVRCQ